MTGMKKFLIILISASICLCTSCSKDLLNYSNPTQLVSSTAYSSEEDINSALTGVYHCFYNSFFAMMNAMMLSGQSDELFSQSPDSGLVAFVNLSYPDYDRSWNYVTWSNLYQMVFRCNQVLEYMKEVSFSKYDAVQIEAQTRALRGMAYYYLAMFYKKAPWVDYIPDPQDKAKESDFDELCGHIADDLQFAYEKLPASYKGEYRVTKWFAASFIGKLYMNRGEYSKALPYYEDIVKKGGFDLCDRYQDNFREDTENNCESIFEIQNYANPSFGAFYGRGNNDANCSFNQFRQKFFSMSPCGFGDYSVYDWLIDAYKSELNKDGGYDLRLRNNIFYKEIFDDFPGEVLWMNRTSWDSDAWKDLNYVRKYTEDYCKTTSQINFYCGINCRILRYGETLLSYAECLANTGDLGKAAEYVNEVRERANMPKLADSTNPDIRNCTASLEAFMDNLDIERAKECCFEYDRFFDLRRFGLGTKDKFTDKVKARSVKHKNNFTSGKEWMPIPRSEVDNNPNLTQNEGF